MYDVRSSVGHLCNGLGLAKIHSTTSWVRLSPPHLIIPHIYIAALLGSYTMTAQPSPSPHTVTTYLLQWYCNLLLLLSYCAEGRAFGFHNSGPSHWTSTTTLVQLSEHQFHKRPQLMISRNCSFPPGNNDGCNGTKTSIEGSRLSRSIFEWSQPQNRTKSYHQEDQGKFCMAGRLFVRQSRSGGERNHLLYSTSTQHLSCCGDADTTRPRLLTSEG